jgi:hypothetical protein
VAGVGLAAVVASAVMFFSHYPASTPLHYSQGGQDEPAQAPVRLVSPRAMTAEEMRAGASESAPLAKQNAAVEPAPTALVADGDRELQSAPVDLPPALAESPDFAEPGIDGPSTRPSPGDTADEPPFDAPVVSTTLVAETRSTEPAPVDELEVVRVEESLALQAPAPGLDEPDESEPTLIEVLASTAAEAPSPGDSAGPVKDEPPAEASAPIARERSRPYPDARRRYLPPMPPYPPAPPYMRRSFGPGGYYPMNTAANGD